MRIYAAKKPERITLVEWDGTNTQEVNEYLWSVSDPDDTLPELVDHGDNTGHVVSVFPDRPIAAGDYVNAVPAMWAGPTITIYKPDEVNAVFYTYPDYAHVVTSTLGGVL